MTQEEAWILDRLEQLHRGRLQVWGVIPFDEGDKLQEKTVGSKRLLDNYRALLSGPHSSFWRMEVSSGQRLYLSGKAKPSQVNAGTFLTMAATASRRIRAGMAVTLNEQGEVCPSRAAAEVGQRILGQLLSAASPGDPLLIDLSA